jgi:hypothetical protein
MAKNSGLTQFGVPTSDIGLAQLSKKAYLARLNDLRVEIESNNSGAFARWIQDPAYLALFIPTGTSGILAAIAQFCFKQ